MKAILVVDIPDDYQEYGSGDWYIVGDDVRIVYEEDGSLITYKFIDYDMAQLKPMPEKKEITDAMIWNSKYESRASYYGGYNACIDELLGDENE